MIDDLLIIEDLDVGDESELRRVVSTVEALVAVPGWNMQPVFLTTEQWKTLIQRGFSSTLRRGADLYINILSDPSNPQRLLISPSALRGINEKSMSSYQEVIYTTLRALPTELTNPLRRGVDDLLAESVAQRLDVPEVFTRNAPRESSLIRKLTTILQRSHGYNQLDWTVVFRRNPERVFNALAKNRRVGPELTSLIQQASIDWKNPKLIEFAKMAEDL